MTNYTIHIRIYMAAKAYNIEYTYFHIRYYMTRTPSNIEYGIFLFFAYSIFDGVSVI